MKDVFLSRPNWVPEQFTDGVNNFYTLLKANDLNPRTIGQSDFPSKCPLDEVIGLLKKCQGTIVLGVPQIQIQSGIIKGKALSDDLELGTEWNHIEAALAHSLGQPMLIIHHIKVKRGIFERGASNSFLHQVNLEDPSWSMSNDISGALLNWKSELKLGIIQHTNIEQKERPTLKWGGYKFDGEEGLFCPVCYNKEGIKMPASRVNSRYYQCPSCKAKLS